MCRNVWPIFAVVELTPQLQQAINRMMTSLCTATVRPCRCQARLRQRALLLRHIDYSLAGLK